jgi:hypothetical protein
MLGRGHPDAVFEATPDGDLPAAGAWWRKTRQPPARSAEGKYPLRLPKYRKIDGGAFCAIWRNLLHPVSLSAPSALL